MVDGMHFGSQHISMNTNLFNENGVSTSKGRGCASTCVVAFYCCNALLKCSCFLQSWEVSEGKKGDINPIGSPAQYAKF